MERRRPVHTLWGGNQWNSSPFAFVNNFSEQQKGRASEKVVNVRSCWGLQTDLDQENAISLPIPCLREKLWKGEFQTDWWEYTSYFQGKQRLEQGHLGKKRKVFLSSVLKVHFPVTPPPCCPLLVFSLNDGTPDLPCDILISQALHSGDFYSFFYVFIEFILFAWHCPQFWGSRNKSDMFPWRSSYSSGETDIKHEIIIHCQNLVMELPLTCRWFIHSACTCYRGPSAGQAPGHSSERTVEVAVLKALWADKNGFSEIRRNNHVVGAQ